MQKVYLWRKARPAAIFIDVNINITCDLLVISAQCTSFTECSILGDICPPV